nr:hypothetical protein [Tanacetum cinerariifolium]
NQRRDSTTKADLGLSAPSNFIPQQQEKTKSISEGLETVLTQPITGKGVGSIAKQVEEDEASRTINLKDLAKLVSSVQPSFNDLDSPDDDPVIVVDDSDEDEEDEVHATTNAETEDTSVPKSSSPKSYQITQKKIEEETKAKTARCEGEMRKEELIDLLGLKVVNKYYNDKLQPLSEQDPLDRLNDLANKKIKHADDVHDFFRANKRLKSSVQYEDRLAGTVLNEHVLGLDDPARTFSSLLLAEIDKRNLNPLKPMRVIEQLRQ